MTKNTYQVVLPFVRRVSSSVALKTFLREQSPCKEKEIEKENFIERAELGKSKIMEEFKPSLELLLMKKCYQKKG